MAKIFIEVTVAYIRWEDDRVKELDVVGIRFKGKQYICLLRKVSSGL